MENDTIHEKLGEHDKRLDKHEDKIDKLEKNDAILRLALYHYLLVNH